MAFKATPSMSVEEFWANCTFVPDTGCWLWLGAGEKYGFARVNGVYQGTHRHAYELATGRKLGPLCACHSCDVKCCINPDHIWAGTDRDNILDSYRKDRSGLVRRKPWGHVLVRRDRRSSPRDLT